MLNEAVKLIHKLGEGFNEYKKGHNQSTKQSKMGKHYSKEPTKASIKLKKIQVIPEVFCELDFTMLEAFYDKFEKAR